MSEEVTAQTTPAEPKLAKPVPVQLAANKVYAGSQKPLIQQFKVDHQRKQQEGTQSAREMAKKLEDERIADLRALLVKHTGNEDLVKELTLTDLSIPANNVRSLKIEAPGHEPIIAVWEGEPRFTAGETVHASLADALIAAESK